jgi:glycosyltransferase involved in cell wall biosynthesis
MPSPVTITPPTNFPGRVGIQQRVFPAYRTAFFEQLSRACQSGLSLFAGKALPTENVTGGASLKDAVFFPAHNLNFFPISSPIYQCWQLGLLRWLYEWQPDILVIEANSRYPSTRLAIKWMHRRGRKVVGWGLGSPPLPAQTLLQKFLRPLRTIERATLLNSLDGVISYSRRGAEEYRLAGFPTDRIFVAPNAVTPRPVGNPPSRPGHFTGKPKILFVGRLQRRKRIDVLLQACSDLPTQLQPVVTIVGDGPVRTELETLSKRIYHETIFTGQVSGSDLEPYFQEADLFVLPGTGGLAVQQAMSFALPVIVAEGDGTQEDLVSQANGWVVAPDNLQALRVSLQTALEDPHRLRQMGLESCRIVKEKVNLEEMTAAFVKALVEISGMDRR